MPDWDDVREIAGALPGVEEGTLSFRVYRDPANPDYLLFVEHFANQAAYDEHTGSAAYKELIAGQFANLIDIEHSVAGGAVQCGSPPGNEEEFRTNKDATILHQLGLDNRKVTFQYQGRQERPTTVFGDVIKEIVA